jgi:hypothetical protein
VQVALLLPARERREGNATAKQEGSKGHAAACFFFWRDALFRLASYARSSCQGGIARSELKRSSSTKIQQTIKKHRAC